jgi:hypothetical protein
MSLTIVELTKKIAIVNADLDKLSLDQNTTQTTKVGMMTEYLNYLTSELITLSESNLGEL